MTYARVLGALADPTRRAILDQLRGRELPVGELAGTLPISRPAVSQHLKQLKVARLVTERSEGTRNYYRLDREGFDAVKRYVDDLWGPVLTAFRDYAQSEGEREERLNQHLSERRSECL